MQPLSSFRFHLSQVRRKLTGRIALAQRCKKQCSKVSGLPGLQIGVLAIQFVIFERYVDILITFGVAPSRALVDEFIFRTGRSWRPKDRLNLLLGCLFADLIVVGAIKLGNRVSIVAPHQKQNA
jgi:hypothetical protein